MSRNRPSPFADFIVIAISPAYIMLLVSSLIFFLLTAFYDGAYDFRLRYIAALFVFATVLIGRISVQEGTQYAAAFALPLALATWLTLVRVTDANSLVILMIIGITWWSAHKLTWDCTVLDENEEDVGEGLLQSAGFDADFDHGASGNADDATKAATAGDGSLVEGTAEGRPENDGNEQPGLMRWWKNWAKSRRQPHAPGVWIIYYVLVTLPLFGLGQWWIPSSDEVARRSAFHCLVVYVASALALMGTTSFLGLRRYLRQRRLEMPVNMAFVWAGSSAAVILGILLVCSFLPRPAPEYSLTRSFSSPGNRLANRFAWIRDGGARDDRTGRAHGDDAPFPESESQAGHRASDSPAEADAASDSKTRHRAAGGDASNEDSKSGDAESQRGTEEPQGHDGKAESRDDSAQRDSGQAQRGNESSGKQQANGKQRANDQQRGSGDSDSSSSQRSGSDSKNSSNPRSPPGGSPSLFQTVSAAARSLMKLLYWAIVAGAVLYFCWRHGRAIFQAIAQFIADVRRLFRGPTRSEASEEIDQAPVDKRRDFGSFDNPFRSGRELPDTDLIRYTFQAMEAWGREHACPRRPDATPYEFAKKLAHQFPPMGTTSDYLVRLYDQLAYASNDLSDPISRDPIRKLWQQMQQS